MSARSVITATVARDRGVFMISVAAELAEMHPADAAHVRAARADHAEALAQGHAPVLRDDVERLRRIQQMTAELGMNLAGVEKVLELEQQLERMHRRVEQLERRAERMQAEMERRLEELRRASRAEIVRYESPGRR